MKELIYTGEKTPFYIADELTAKTVTLAIRLRRPILVEGEPGCGKTTLASSIAYELGLPLVKLTVNSATRAQDLLYQVDALRRLQDAQRKDNEESRYIHPYVSLGKLGESIHLPHLDGKRRVVLIDEIDKADIDFPNDLLGVLDKFEFSIDPLSVSEEEQKSLSRNKFGYSIQARPGLEPIVVITSNREKRLPEPFLRRCLYVRVLFPKDQDSLKKIVLRNLATDEIEELNRTILLPAVQAFWDVRERSKTLDVQKKPTTSELIDWIRILLYEKKTVIEIESQGKYPPYWELLFKTMNDLELYASEESNS